MKANHLRHERMTRKKTSFEFGTKAETLARLQPLVTKARIPAFLYFSVNQWHTETGKILAQVGNLTNGCNVIVRSSAIDEDGKDSAMAGLYESVPSIPGHNHDALRVAVEAVISSYRRKGDREVHDHQVLIQIMLEQVLMSGALFTQDLNTGAPYYVINYDDQSGRTDTVTSGNEYSNRTLYVHRGAVAALRSKRFKQLLAAVEELERFSGSESLDIEFALDNNLQVHLFQVRPITTKPNWNRGIALRVDQSVRQIQNFVRHRLLPVSGVHGKRSLFGQMPDWNPAEMIGRTPRPLSLSLYRYLITDRAWRQARRKMGYAEPHGMPLMVSLGGQPFIDVRLSFHSYLPMDLPESIGGKLVDAWLDRLTENPHLHDKVEFDVAVTCLTLDFEERVARQFADAMLPDEKRIYRDCLRQLTNKLLTNNVAPIADELARIEYLDTLRVRLLSTKKHPDLATVASLLEECIEFGTIPFSILARHAFIAQALLRSLVARGVLTERDFGAFQHSIRTVASDLADDTRRLLRGEINRSTFMERYGHLRPGTYDILSPRYDQREDLFCHAPIDAQSTLEHHEFALSAQQQSDVSRLLADEQLGIDAKALFVYCRDSIVAREYAKFVFTKNISDALEAIANWAEQVGLNRDELSFLDIREILDTLATAASDSVKSYLRALSEDGRQRHETTVALRLPQVLCIEQDVEIVPLRIEQPNFITAKLVRGRCIQLHEYEEVEPDISNKIVLIEKADPGFDWIFAYGIQGLITKYGGSNSHMAIRCAEFSIPAAIGCGEQIFDRLEHARAIELNCAESVIRQVEE